MTKHGSDPGFVPISPNPYIVGNPVRDRSMFFGREAEFLWLRQRLDSPKDCGLVVFCGERRSGKTSILFQVLDNPLDLKIIPVLIDMQSIPITNDADFFAKIAEQVLTALGPRAEGIAPPDFREGSNYSDTFRRFITRTRPHWGDNRLVLLFDEYELFENKIEQGQLSRDTLSTLAALTEHDNVFLVFTGSQHIELRDRDYWRVLLPRSNWRQISYLERSDAVRLICDPVSGRVTYAPGIVDAILRLAAGQPFYTQAICQSLVDQLNERKTHEVTREILDDVVRGLVENALPQMIFHWDSLRPRSEEMLTLALLAEVLTNGTEVARDRALVKLIHTRDYPLEIHRDRIAVALESLFRAELLSKDDRMRSPGFAFKMDLWRLWIQRMHSVWQVMRELGLSLRRRWSVRIGPYRLFPRDLAIAAAALLVVLAASEWQFRWWEGLTKRSRPEPPPSSSSQVGPLVTPVLGVNPPSETIEAPFANLRIQTTPPGAQITVDGVPQDPSPVTVRHLPLAKPAAVAASLPGFVTELRSVQLPKPDTTHELHLRLRPLTFNLVVTSQPPGASVTMDSRPPVTATATLPGVSYGKHEFAARLEGYEPRDTTLVISDANNSLDFVLAALPPGELTIVGEKIATFYVDGDLVGDDATNCGPRSLPPGTHTIKVKLGSGETISRSINMQSRKKLVYNFSTDTLTERR